MPAQAKWSEMNRALVEHAGRAPALRTRPSFRALVDGAPQRYRLQPWPIFVGPTQRRELADIALGIDRLVRSALERFLGNDHQRILEFYQADNPAAVDHGKVVTPIQLSPEMLRLLLEPPNAIDAVPSRSDFIDSPDGLKCVEMNIGGNLGGLQIERFRDLYLASGPVAEFVRESNISIEPPNVLRLLFLHIVEHTHRLGVWRGGDFTLAMIIGHREDETALHSIELYERLVNDALVPLGGGRARVVLCRRRDFVDAPAGLHVGPVRVHAVIEQVGNSNLSLPYRHFKRGTIGLFSTPATHLLSDKRTLALLSTHAESAELTESERALIARHIPWTRRVEATTTTFRGQTFHIPHDASASRSAFVLKKANSSSGVHVFLGKYHTDAEWNALIERALRERDWILQERIESAPYSLQADPEGIEAYDAVWGLYTFGGRYAGVFLRLAPVRDGHQIINVHNGAEVGTVFEIDR